MTWMTKEMIIKRNIIRNNYPKKNLSIRGEIRHIKKLTYVSKVSKVCQSKQSSSDQIVLRRRESSNLEFSCEVSKVWLRIVCTVNQTWVFQNDSS
jgi:hypothetical protein